MGSSTTLLDLISVSQAAKEQTANALFDAASPTTLFGRRASTTAALTWGYYGGVINGVQVPNGTLTLTASSTNYIESNSSTGVVTVNTSGWTGGVYVQLYQVVTGIGTVTSYVDWRSTMGAVSVPMNALLLTDYAQDTATTTGLTYGFKAGVIRNDNTPAATTAGTIALTASTTNYVEVTGAGVVNVNVVGFTAGRFPMATVVTGSSTITSVTDKRCFANVMASGGAASLTVTNVWSKNQSCLPAVLTSASTVNTDASLSNNFTLTLATNAVLANPTNLTDGMVLNFKIKQDATGSRLLTYGSKFKFPGGTAPVLSTVPAANDFMSCYYDATDNVLMCNAAQGFA